MSDCLICLSDIGENKVQLSCVHAFHRNCIKNWIQSGNTENYKLCPTCRIPIKTKTKYLICKEPNVENAFSTANVIDVYIGVLLGLDGQGLTAILNTFLKINNRLYLRNKLFIDFNGYVFMNLNVNSIIHVAVKRIGYELFDKPHEWYMVSVFIVVSLYSCKNNFKQLLCMQKELQNFLINELNIVTWKDFRLERECEYYRHYEQKVCNLYRLFLESIGMAVIP